MMNLSQIGIRSFLSGLLLLLASLCVSSCAGIQTSINPAGPQADQISRLWWLMFSVCTGVFVLVMIFTLLAIKRGHGYSQEPTRAPDLDPALSAEQRKRNVVIGAIIVTTLILFVFLIASFKVGRSMTSELANKNGLTIEITGHQWWWEVRYMDPSASNVFTTANEIHIPTGVPVTFSLRANDVIHSFWVPNLSGKKDLIPGKIATIWLQADRPGVYRGQCAEYCGLQHAHMALWIVAEPQEQFDSWRQNQTRTAIQAVTSSEQRGQQVFLSSTCVMCHAVNGTPAGSNFGPNLTHIASRSMIAAATLPNTRDHLVQWVTDSQAIKPGNKMPQNNLSAEDLNALLDYLGSLK
ncbi:MAG: cytochrome c oxidase subunit [Blastocatellia bacterium]|jgi:cytochrome c oxidase subunit 2|nr:cytochrome c oxidase subunit [Blastocatellia bacterium]